MYNKSSFRKMGFVEWGEDESLYLSVIGSHTGPEPVHLRAPDLVCEPLVLFLTAPS